jgi:hypothetical protein
MCLAGLQCVSKGTQVYVSKGTPVYVSGAHGERGCERRGLAATRCVRASALKGARLRRQTPDYVTPREARLVYDASGAPPSRLPPPPPPRPHLVYDAGGACSAG